MKSASVSELKAQLESANKLREAAESAAEEAHDKLQEIDLSRSERTQIVQSPLEEKKLSWWRSGVVVAGILAGTWLGFEALGVGPAGGGGGGSPGQTQ